MVFGLTFTPTEQQVKWPLVLGRLGSFVEVHFISVLEAKEPKASQTDKPPFQPQNGFHPFFSEPRDFFVGVVFQH